MQRLDIPALPFIPEKKIERPTKEERKKFIDDNKEKFEEELKMELEKPETKIVERNDEYKEYDGTQTLLYMKERIDEGRGWLKYARSPPVSQDPYKNKEVRKEIEEFLESGIYIISEEIIHNIENLIVFAKYNESMFGKYNHAMGEITLEIFGVDQIKEQLNIAKESNSKKEAMSLFSKLLNVASRPLQMHGELIKQTIYEPAISDSALNESMERG